VCRLANSRVIHVQITADGAHHDLSRVQPHADLHVHAVRPARVLGIPLHRLLHPERGVAGADGMVLVGEGRAEEGMIPSPMTWFTVPS
jgi:hypothetical protein